jgi:hypothetical protein
LARIDETRDLSIEEKAARQKWKNAPIFDCADSTPEAAKKKSDYQKKKEGKKYAVIVTKILNTNSVSGPLYRDRLKQRGRSDCNVLDIQ